MGTDAGAGGGSTGVVASFFCLLVLTDDMVGGGCDSGGSIFCVRRAFSKRPPHKKIEPLLG
jgi:hypothetical protein